MQDNVSHNLDFHVLTELWSFPTEIEFSANRKGKKEKGFHYEPAGERALDFDFMLKSPRTKEGREQNREIIKQLLIERNNQSAKTLLLLAECAEHARKTHSLFKCHEDMTRNKNGYFVSISKDKNQELRRIDTELLEHLDHFCKTLSQIQDRFHRKTLSFKYGDFLNDVKNNKLMALCNDLIEQLRHYEAVYLRIGRDSEGQLTGISMCRQTAQERIKKVCVDITGDAKQNEEQGFASQTNTMLALALVTLIPQLQHVVLSAHSIGLYFEFIIHGFEYTKMLMSARIPYVFPSFSDDGTVTIKNLRNPCLFQRVLGCGPTFAEHVVPNSIRFNRMSRIAIITGQNNAGKTTFAKSIGLAHLLGLAGFPIPAESAILSDINAVYTLFMMPSDITKESGMLDAKIEGFLDIMKTADKKSLIIADELVEGTSEKDAIKIFNTMIRGLVAFGGIAVITTHHQEAVRNIAQKYPEIKTYKMEIKRQQKRPQHARPTHKIIPGIGSSNGARYAHRKELTVKNVLRLARMNQPEN